ncbi:hypothetical protein [Elioraea sp.]|uniref:hypothetical protein n=1 Tax=Elioraea sp. TaxID=2185103 RepID=UPI0025C0150C|nr:hypothetical protein [Elioraea sp.]
MTLSVTVEANVGQFQADMSQAARAVESTTARMNRAVATVDRAGQRFDAVEGGIKRVNRALGDATGALTLFGSGGSSVARQLAPITGTLAAVADAFGTLTTVARGGAAGVGLASIVPVLGAVVAGATALYGAYRLLAPATQAVSTAEDQYQEALRLSEPFARSAAEASAELERQKRAQAAATIVAAQATLQEAVAQRQADLAFAQSAAAEAARQAQTPARRGTLRQGAVGQALQGTGNVEREITADIERLNERLATLGQRLGAVNAPAAAAGAGLRNAAAAAETLEQVLARLRNSPAAQASAEAQRVLNEQVAEARGIYQGVLTPLERYQQSLERLGELRPALEGLYGQQGAETVIQRQAEALQRGLAAAERQTNRGAEAARELGLTFSSAFEDAVVGGKKFSDVLKGLSADLARLIVRRSITEPLANAASQAVSGIGASIGSFFGLGGSGGGGGGSSIVAGAASGTLLERLLGVNFGFGGPRAMGGPVAGGTTYLVGERGPELFTPGRSGEIIPNGGFGGRSETINVSVDARGSSIGPAELRAAVIAGIGQARALVRDDFRRDPRMRALAQGRA